MNNVAQLFSVDPAPQQSRFEEFWKAYPYCRRERRALAKAKFDAITGPGLKTRTMDKDSGTYVEIELRATPDEIIEGAKRYDQRMRQQGLGKYGYKDDGRYVCQPATWLNQGRWEDE